MRAQLTTGALAMALALALLGCSVERLPFTEPPPTSPSPTPTASVTAPATPRPSPTLLVAQPIWPLPSRPVVEIPTGELPTEAVVEDRGVRLRLILERNPMPAGEPTWVTTELTNTGPDQLIWVTDGCAIHASVRGELTSHRWGAGVAQQDLAATFKLLVSRRLGGDGIMRLDFVPEAFLGQGEFGCADVGLEHRLAAGERVTSRLQWDGFIWQAGVPPTAEVVVSATFDGWRREREGVNRRRELSARLPVWIAGDVRASLMSPEEATDLALRDPRLAGWIRLVWRDRGNTFVQFDRRAGAWWIGLALPREGRDLTEGRVAIVDAATGQILGVFDVAVDGRGTATIIGPVP